MRTTITIPDELAAAAKKMSGKRRLSEAIADVIRENESRRKRLSVLQLFSGRKPPHDWKKIKADRKKRTWSA
jgi:predicted CopG family antitoxin